MFLCLYVIDVFKGVSNSTIRVQQSPLEATPTTFYQPNLVSIPDTWLRVLFPTHLCQCYGMSSTSLVTIFQSYQ